MKNLLFILILLLIKCSVSLAQNPPPISVSQPNSQIITLTPDQRTALINGGFTLDVYFNNANLNESHIFQLLTKNGTNNAVAVMRVRKYNSKLWVRRNVKWQPCLNWDSSGCVKYDTSKIGNDMYSTWDDKLFIKPDNTPLTSGHLMFTLANNAMKIRVGTGSSPSQEDTSIKCDLSYEGLSFSRLLHELESADTVKIGFINASEIGLSDAIITLNVGKVTANAKEYPELNFKVNGFSAGRVASTCDCEETEIYNQQDENKDFTLFPVPVDERITLQTTLGKSVISEFTIVDLTGKVVDSYVMQIESGKQTTELSINRTKVIPGVYVFRFQGDGKLFTGKLVVK